MARSIQLVVVLLILFGLQGCSTTHEESDQHHPDVTHEESDQHHPDVELFSRIHEVIQNRIESHPDIRLAVHCSSGDDDLGVHMLHLWEQFAWNFRRNFFSKTLFTCKMAWHNNAGRYAYKSFEVYREYWTPGSPILDTCKECYWTAREEGIFLNDLKIYTWELYDLP